MGKYYVYVIKSLVNERHYVGFTKDISNRLRRHNKRKVKATKAYVPYEIVYVEECDDRTKARKRELFLKTGQGRDYIKNVIDCEKRTGVRVV